MTNDELDTAIATEADRAALAGLDTTPELDALFADRSARIAGALRALQTVSATVSATQADRLESQLPESLCGLAIVGRRVTGTPADFADALACLDDDAALDYAEGDCMTDTTAAQDAFRERSVLRSMAALRRALSALSA